MLIGKIYLNKKQYDIAKSKFAIALDYIEKGIGITPIYGKDLIKLRRELLILLDKKDSK